MKAHGLAGWLTSDERGRGGTVGRVKISLIAFKICGVMALLSIAYVPQNKGESLHQGGKDLAPLCFCGFFCVK